MDNELFLNATLAPIISNKRIIVLVSRRSGTLFIVVLPSTSSAAVIKGKTAFFAPLISTLPEI